LRTRLAQSRLAIISIQINSPMTNFLQIDESWLYPPSLEAAVEIQKMLADRIILKDDFDEINLLGGMDVSNNPYDKKQLVYGTLVTLKRDTLQHQEVANHCLQEKFPYITGFL
jgi:deoxyribonuclease V